MKSIFQTQKNHWYKISMRAFFAMQRLMISPDIKPLRYSGTESDGAW
jgi:hypothetical protein